MKKGSLDKIADYILDGKHEKLEGIHSDIPAVQEFLDKIPFYVVSILLLLMHSFRMSMFIIKLYKIIENLIFFFYKSNFKRINSLLKLLRHYKM